MKAWDRVEDFAGWWFEGITIAFNLVILAGAVLAGVLVTSAEGWVRVVGTVVGLLVLLVGLRLQAANWRENRH